MYYILPSKIRVSVVFIVDDDTENCPVFTTPSPSKKKKDKCPSPVRRDETPIRASLAAKLATVKVTDEQKGIGCVLFLSFYHFFDFVLLFFI